MWKNLLLPVDDIVFSLPTPAASKSSDDEDEANNVSLHHQELKRTSSNAHTDAATMKMATFLFIPSQMLVLLKYK